MRFTDLQLMFNRAFALSFSRTKMVLTFLVLASCGLLVVFCRGLGVAAGGWVLLSLSFLPVFLCAGLLIAMGIVLIRAYHHEVKKRPHSYRSIISKSMDLMFRTSYFAVPLILLYLLLWICLGLFFLLKEMPFIGDYIGAIFAFGPFLLILGSLILCVGTVVLLFFVTPAVALSGRSLPLISREIIYRLTSNVFLSMVFIAIGLIPLLIEVGLLSLAAVLVEVSYFDYADVLHKVLQWFFIMVPFTAILSPAVIFFFNFAAETHSFFKKRMKHEAAGLSY